MHCGTVRIRDLSSLPRYIDHDGDTSDGMSYAGTERWNWTIIDERFASGHVRATALSMNVQSRVGWGFRPLSVNAGMIAGWTLAKLSGLLKRMGTETQLTHYGPFLHENSDGWLARERVGRRFLPLSLVAAPLLYLCPWCTTSCLCDTLLDGCLHWTSSTPWPGSDGVAGCGEWVVFVGGWWSVATWQQLTMIGASVEMRRMSVVEDFIVVRLYRVSQLFGPRWLT